MDHGWMGGKKGGKEGGRERYGYISVDTWGQLYEAWIAYPADKS